MPAASNSTSLVGKCYTNLWNCSTMLSPVIFQGLVAIVILSSYIDFHFSKLFQAIHKVILDFFPDMQSWRSNTACIHWITPTMKVDLGILSISLSSFNIIRGMMVFYCLLPSTHTSFHLAFGLLAALLSLMNQIPFHALKSIVCH